MDRILKGLLYKFFSLAFTYPDEKTIRAMEDILGDLKELTNGFNELINDVAEVVRVLKETDLGKLQTEYVRLFVNAYPKVPCPPYESFYKTGLLSDYETIKDLLEFYQRFELLPKGEMADHIRVMLEYLYVANLSDKVSDEECSEIEERFLKKHLLKWVKKFAKCVEENSNLEFFKKVSSTLIKFLES